MVPSPHPLLHPQTHLSSLPLTPFSTSPLPPPPFALQVPLKALRGYYTSWKCYSTCTKVVKGPWRTLSMRPISLTSTYLKVPFPNLTLTLNLTMIPWSLSWLYFFLSSLFPYLTLAEQRAAEKHQMAATLEQNNKAIRPASPNRPRSALAMKLLTSKVPQVSILCSLAIALSCGTSSKDHFVPLRFPFLRITYA